MKLLGYDFEIKKASKLPAVVPSQGLLSQAAANQLYDALYRFYGSNMPIWIKDDLETYITKGYAYNADVYQIVNYIITTAATVPWKWYKRKADNTLEPVNDAKLYKLTNNPNELQGKSAFNEALLGYKLITGNTYAYKIAADAGTREGQALEMYVMPAHLVQILGGGITSPIGGYNIRFMPGGEIAPDKVMHSKYFNPDTQGMGGEDLYGLSPIKALARVVTQSNSAFQANAASFQNMGATGIISQDPTGLDSEMVFTQEQMNTIKRTFAKEYTGPDKFNKIAFTSASIKYQQLGLSPVDMAILGSMELSFEQLCGGWKFPSELLRSKNSTYNTRDAAKKSLYEDCIMPELNTLAEDMHKWLALPFGDEYCFLPDFSGVQVLQSNRTEQANWLNASWWLSPNQKLEQQGFPKSTDPLMDKVYIPSMLTPMDDIGAITDPSAMDTTQAAKELDRLGIGEYSFSSNGKH